MRVILRASQFGRRRYLSIWVDQRTSSSAVRLSLPIVKGTIYPQRIVRRTDGEYIGVGDIRAYNTSIGRMHSLHARPR